MKVTRQDSAHLTTPAWNDNPHPFAHVRYLSSPAFVLFACSTRMQMV
jgi:hypothetical protein